MPSLCATRSSASSFVISWVCLIAAGGLACGPKQPTKTPVADPAPPVVQAEPKSIVDRERLRTQLDAYVEAMGAEWGPAFRFSGFVLVTEGDEAIYERGFGAADRDTGRAPTIDTSFRVGSVTKQFTAAAILKLREQGKLDVTDTVRTHIPEFPSPGGDVTIHQLLTHTSGVWSYTSDPALMETRAEAHTVQQMLELFWDKPLDFEPGSEFRYSNSGYVVLGAIIEAASGGSYGEYLQTELFEPAKLTRTEYGDHQGLDDRAGAYERTPEETITEAHPIHMSVPFAAGGIRSTARDLWTWHHALSGEAILSEESKTLLYTPDKQEYAYGWTIGVIDGHATVAHGGGIDGFATAYERLVDDDIVIVVWSNVGPQAGSIADAAKTLVLGKSVQPVQEQAPAPLDPAIGPKAEGSYLLANEDRDKLRAMGLPDEVIATFERIEVRAGEGFLLLDPIGQPAVRMYPKGDGTYFGKDGRGLTLELDLPDDATRAKGVRTSQGPIETYFGRAPLKTPISKGRKGRGRSKGTRE